MKQIRVVLETTSNSFAEKKIDRGHKSTFNMTEIEYRRPMGISLIDSFRLTDSFHFVSFDM